MSIVGTRVRDGLAAGSRLRALWLALLALTMLATVVSLFTFPIEAQEGEFIHALRAGEITRVAVGHSDDFNSDTGFSSNSSNDFSDVAVVWVNRFGVRRKATLNYLMALDPLLSNAEVGTIPPTPTVDAVASIAATARSLGAAPPSVVRPDELPLGGITWLPGAVTVLMILIMLFGPQPRRTTKWGAFWAYTAPLNLGIFWALLRDSPWNDSMNRLPEPRAGDRVAVNLTSNQQIVRIGGWTTLLLANLALKFALSMVLLAIMWAIPDFVDPVVWTAIDHSGNRLTIP
jgi:hypothetical protein